MEYIKLGNEDAVSKSRHRKSQNPFSLTNNSQKQNQAVGGRVGGGEREAGKPIN